MPERPGFSIAAQVPVDGKNGATATFPYDCMTVERFRSAFAARGPYCGAIGWIGFDGAMDTSIVIRALTLTPNRVIAQAGGGIVADSNPVAEYAEMMTKVAPALAALGINEEDAWSYG